MAGARSSIGMVGLWLFVVGSAGAGDRAQWGEAWGRNMVSAEVGLPVAFGPKTGKNVKWVAELGTETHSSPVVSGGRVLIGTNNGVPRSAKYQGDRGVLMCFDESDGSLVWQCVVPKRTEDRFFDWPMSGMSSPATVDGERVYIVNNRGDLMCLDLAGMVDGNGGAFTGEAAYYAEEGRAPVELDGNDADILWVVNLTEEAGIWSHDAAHSSVLVDGGLLYVNSGTGVDRTHKAILRPEAPSLLVFEKATGKLVAREQEGIGPNIFHNTWSAPSMAVAGGEKRLFFCAGNGLMYAFNPPGAQPGAGVGVGVLEKTWSYDLDPEAPKTGVHAFNGNRLRGPSNYFGMPVVVDGSVYAAGGGDLWWGKNRAWLVKVDGAEGREVWRYDLNRHVMATPAVSDGLVFIGDTGRSVHCVDAATGEGCWVHDVEGELWASPLVADGKVYFVTRKGQFLCFEAGREKRLLGEVGLREKVSATPVAANGVLYVATMGRLFALEMR